MHDPYENTFKHKADFRVKYKLRPYEEGGRRPWTTFQGIRFDFSYEGEKGGAYMVWPEFEDENGDVILYDDRPVPESGTARMWVLFNDMRPLHIEKIRVGVKGFFLEGGRKVADCEVIEILDLKINPTER